MPSITVVLPALDEAAALPTVLAGLPAGCVALVVDNGSSDGTAEVARSLGARVVVEPLRGFGAACHTGLMTATTDLVAFCDADGSIDLRDLHTVAAPLTAGDADIVLGARVQTERSAWPAHARLANRYLAWRLHRRFGLPLTDLGPLRIATRRCWRSLDVRDRRSGWPLEQLVRAGQLGLRVAEVPVRYNPRIGRSKVTGTLGGTISAARDMRRVLRGR